MKNILCIILGICVLVVTTKYVLKDEKQVTTTQAPTVAVAAPTEQEQPALPEATQTPRIDYSSLSPAALKEIRENDAAAADVLKHSIFGRVPLEDMKALSKALADGEKALKVAGKRLEEVSKPRY